MSAVNIKVSADITKARKEIAVLQNRISRMQQASTKDFNKFSKAGNQALIGLVQSAGLARVSFAGAGYAISRFATNALQEYARLEKGWTEVTTLMPNQTRAMTDAMNVEMRKLAKDTGKYLGDVYRAAYEAVSAGVPADATPEFMRIATDAALGGVTDMTTAVDGLTTVLNTYNLAMDKTSLVSDQFFTAVRLGKCVGGATRVLLADGRYERIDRLSDGARVVSFDGRGFVPMDAQWVEQGTKPTVTMTTRLGRQITTTWTHPYLTEHGWREVRDLSVGDKIAVPTHLPYHGSDSVPEHVSGLLGLWLAEGSSLVHGGPRVCSTRYGDQIETWAKEWGCVTSNIERRDGRAPVWDMTTGPTGRGRSNPILDWLRSLGLGDATSATKHIPDQVWSWDRASQTHLLRWLFNGDGWLADLRPHNHSGFQVGFCSKSEQLVRDISHLLLRFGIVGKVRDRGNAWVWEINRYREVRRFVDLVGIDRPAADLVADHEPVKQRAMWGVVEYDPIVSIEAGDPEPVYDLCVPGLANFVAEDIVAHNTTFPLLAYNVAQVTPIAEAMGIGFDQVAAGLAALTAQGRPTAQAATQIRAALDQMSDAETKVGKLFKTMSGQSFPEFLDAGGTMREAMVIVVDAAEKSGKQVAEVFGRVEGALGALGLASEASARIHEQYMGDIEGATATAAEKMKDTLGHELDLFKRQWDDLKVSTSEELAPVIRPIIESSGDALKLLSWIIGESEGPTTRDVQERFGAATDSPSGRRRPTFGYGYTDPETGRFVDVDPVTGQAINPVTRTGLTGGQWMQYAKRTAWANEQRAKEKREQFAYESGLAMRQQNMADMETLMGRGFTLTKGGLITPVMEAANAAKIKEAQEAELAAQQKREREERARQEAMWGTQWAAWMRGDTPDMQYFGQLQQKRDYLGGLQTKEGVEVQEEINRLVLATETKQDDNIFYVNLRSDDKPDRMLRAERGPIRGRPRGACG